MRNINDSFNRLDDTTKALVLELVSRVIYDETIDLKCLNEKWDGNNRPNRYMETKKIRNKSK